MHPRTSLHSLLRGAERCTWSTWRTLIFINNFNIMSLTTEISDIIIATISWILMGARHFTYIIANIPPTMQDKYYSMLNNLLEAKQLGKSENNDFHPVFFDFKVLTLSFHCISFNLSFIKQNSYNAYYVVGTVWAIEENKLTVLMGLIVQLVRKEINQYIT